MAALLLLPSSLLSLRPRRRSISRQFSLSAVISGFSLSPLHKHFSSPLSYVCLCFCLAPSVSCLFPSHPATPVCPSPHTHTRPVAFLFCLVLFLYWSLSCCSCATEPLLTTELNKSMLLWDGRADEASSQAHKTLTHKSELDRLCLCWFVSVIVLPLRFNSFLQEGANGCRETTDHGLDTNQHQHLGFQPVTWWQKHSSNKSLEFWTHRQWQVHT